MSTTRLRFGLLALVLLGSVAHAQPRRTAGIFGGQVLDEDCVVTIQNRSARVNADGSFAIPNVPFEAGIRSRVRAICTRNGRIVRGQSELLDLQDDGAPIRISMVGGTPLPVSLEAFAPEDLTVLTDPDATVALQAIGTLADGRKTVLTGRSAGTTWITSNPRVMTVDETGLARVVGRGDVIIQARNEGLSATVRLTVDLPVDRDGDGLEDEYEVRNGLNPDDPSDANLDLDGDGLTNLEELANNSRPRNADTDGDGISDGDEVARGLRPDRADTDGDGLIDGDEDRHGTDAANADTDGDGINDGDEVRLGFRPTEVDETTEVIGQVVDPDGAAVEGAVVIVERRYVGTTDADGFFSIAPVAADARRLVAQVRRIEESEVLDGRGVAHDITANGTTDMGQIRLRRILNAVGGNIISPRGEPVPDARVFVTVGVDERAANANDEGQYLVRQVREGEVTVIATDASTGLRGRAYGVLEPDESSTIDVQLSASGTLEGAVFDREDAAVGAGVNVTLRGPINIDATTDEVGRFRFDFIPLGLYTLEAWDDAGNRGRTQAAITNTNQVVQANISFLGVGQVAGVVETGGGALVPDAQVTLVGRGPFGGRFETTTNAQGGFRFDDVFIGPFDVSVRDPRSGLAGVTSGTIEFEGDAADVTVTLRGAGAFAGVIYEADGVTPVPEALLEVSPSGRRVTADAQGQYAVDFLPLGAYTLRVFHPGGPDQGQRGASLVDPDVTVTADVLMTGLGTVNVQVLDAAGAQVRRANVRLDSRSGFSQRLDAVTDDVGVWRFERVLAGGFDLTAVEASSGLTGSVQSSVLPGEEAGVTVRLETAGTLAGQVFAADGATPVPNIRVRVEPTGRDAVTDGEGNFRFPLLPIARGPYRLQAFDGRGTLRATAADVALGDHAETITQNLVLSGTGTVAGTVLDEDGVPVAAISVAIDSDVQGMPTLRAVTDAEGQFAVEGIPEGRFSIVANDRARRLAGRASGQMGFDGEIVVIDVRVIADEIPQAPPGAGITTVSRLYDANNTQWAIQTDGSIRDGTTAVFRGDNGANRGGSVLRVIGPDGVPASFLSQGGRFELEGRQVSLTGDGPPGILVTRKIYVPLGGYFARYVEVLRNTTDQPIEIDVEVRDHLRSINRVRNGFTFTETPRLFATSSGDATLFVEGADRDRWAAFDDEVDADPFLSTTLPAVAHVFEGEGDITAGADAAGFGLTGNWGALDLGWRSVVVPPGEIITVMHFEVQQLDRAAAIASATRLAQAPVEALVGLSDDERASMLNFDLAAGDGLDPLPALDSTVTGTVYEGDGQTTSSGARVYLKSDHPLFGRTWDVRADAAGLYTHQGRLGGNGDSRVLPAAEYHVWATHPITGARSDDVMADWPDAPPANTDITFDGTGMIAGEVRRPNGDVVSAGSVRITGDGQNHTVPIAEDGRFFLAGLPPGNYTLVATLPVPGGTALTGRTIADIVAAETAPVLITIVPTGGVGGLVRDGGGNPAVTVRAEMNASGFRRAQNTDTGGRYAFLDAPVGDYAVRGREPVTGVWSSRPVTLEEGLVVEQDLDLIPVGQALVTATYTGGAPLAGASVQIQRDAVGGSFRGVGTTDAGGNIVINGVPRGAFQVRVISPENSLITATVAGALENHREVVPVAVEIFRDEAPQVLLTNPVAGAEFLEGASLLLAAEAQDDLGLRRVEFVVDGEVVGSDSTAPYQLQWNPPQGDGDRQFVITAVAVDNGPNRTTSEPTAITVRDDQNPPIVALVQPFGGASIIEGADFTARADAQDDIGVARVDFSVDGEVVATDDAFPYTVTLTMPADAAADGARPVTVRAVAYDRAGNEGAAERAITVRPDAPPTIEIVQAPADGAEVIEGTEVAFTIAANDDVRAEVDLLLGGEVVQTRAQAPYTFAFTAPAAGEVANPITLVFQARDTQGQTAEVSHRLNVIADTPPTVAIQAPVAGGEVVEGSALTITATAEDELGVTQVRFLIDGLEYARRLAPPYTVDLRVPSGAADEPVVIEVVAVDTAGQEGRDEVRLTRLDDAVAPSGRITAPSDGATVAIGPTDVVLAIANSGEAAANTGQDWDGDAANDTVLGAQVAAARAVLDALDPDLTRISVVNYNTSSGVRQAITGDFAVARAALDAVLAGGTGNNTPRYDNPLSQSVDQLIGAGAQRAAAPAVFLFSSTTGSAPSEATYGRLAAAGITVNAVAVFGPNNASQDTLRGVATRTGGTFYALEGPADAAELANSVLVGADALVVSAEADDDVAVRGVRLEVASADALISAGRTDVTAPYNAVFGLPAIEAPVQVTISGHVEDFGGNETPLDPISVTVLPAEIAPVLTALTPTVGRAGDVVVLDGRFFHPDPAQNLVRFGDVPAVPSAASKIQLTVTVPEGARTGLVTVEAEGLVSRGLAWTSDRDADGLSDEQELALGSDPDLVDTDGDTLPDGVEVNDHGTNPTLVDTDGDGLRDDFELRYEFDPRARGEEGLDLDGDGLTNLDEQTAGTDPTVADTDRDLLPDGEEITIYGSDPTLADTDGGGAGDFQEVLVDETDPTDPADDAEPRGFGFEGIRDDVAEADVVNGGFRLCHADRYNNTTALGGVRDDCSDNVVLLACRPVGSDTFTLAAMGNRDEVFLNVGNARGASHDHNGVSWYYSPSYSMGFFQPGTGVSRNSCDTANTEAAKRMCWHTSNDRISSGYRCGANTLNGNGNWERLIYTRTGVVGAGGAGVGCSLPGGAPVTLTVINDLDEAADYAWVDYGCTEQIRGQLAPGEQVEVQTQARFMWIARDARFGDELGRLTLGDIPRQTLRLTEASLPRVNVNPARTLRDGLEFNWDVAARGEVTDGTSNAFDGAFRLRVGGSEIADQAQAIARIGGRELTLGPVALAGLQVSRKVYVPADEAFVRYQEVLYNASDQPITVPVELTSNLGANANTVLVGTSSGDAAFAPVDDWVVADDADGAGSPAVVHFFSDANLNKIQPVAVTGADGSDVLGVEWSVTVPPGARVIVLHFGAQRADRASALAAAAALSTFQAGELFGMTGAEADAVINLRAGPDADGDGLTDPQEADLGTDPANPDTDGDGLTDGFEVGAGFDPLVPGEQGLDPDADGLDNLGEQTAGTDPNNPDTDGDGALDGDEIALGSDPFNRDSDGDGLLDGDEVDRGTSPILVDTDEDGLDDGVEVNQLGTDPLSTDTDGDGMPDAFEVDEGFDPTDGADALGDRDDDGLSNADEVLAGSDVNNPDTDGDRLLDGAEVNEHGTDPTLADTDGGGVDDLNEVVWDLTDPTAPEDDLPQLQFNVTLNDGNGFQWDVTSRGRINNGTSDAFDGGLRLQVAGSEMSGQPFAVAELDGRQLRMGPWTRNQLWVWRQVYVPANAAFARYQETLHNPTDGDIEVTVRVYNNTGAGGAQAILATSSGAQTAGVDDDWIATDDGTPEGGDPALFFLFSDDADDRVAPSLVFGRAGSDEVYYDWPITVPAGERVSLLHFAAQNSTRLVATQNAETLPLLSGQALFGMTEADRDRVLNLRAYPDADGDGLDVRQEAQLGTDPANPDTDADGLTDGYEVANGFDPLLGGDGDADLDADGLSTAQEAVFGTDPRVADVDEDGLLDGGEFTAGSDPFVADTDGDLLLDGPEVNAYGTDPTQPDSDQGGASDFRELFVDQTDPANPADDIEAADGFTGSDQPIDLPPDPRGFQANHDLNGTSWGDGGNDAFDGYGRIRVTHAGVQSGELPLTIGQTQHSINGYDFTLDLDWANQNVLRYRVNPTRAGDGRPVSVRINGNLGSDGGTQAQLRTVRWNGLDVPYYYTRDAGPSDPPIVHLMMPGRRADVGLVDYSRSGDNVTITGPETALPLTMYIALSYNNDPDAVALALLGDMGAGGVGCSLPDRGDVALTIINELQESADYAWVDYGCAEQPQGTLAPGEQVVVNTQAAFSWIARDTRFGDVLGRITTTGEAQQTLRLTEAGLPRVSVNPSRTLTDSLDYAWDVDPRGRIIDGSRNAFDTAFRLRINGGEANTQNEVIARIDGRQLEYAPSRMGGLLVSRKVYVPEDQAFARFQEVLVNDTDQAITVTAQIYNDFGAGGGTTVAATSSDDAVFAVDDNWIVTEDAAGNTPAVAHVFSDDIASTLEPAAVVGASGSAITTVDWRITVEPGERAIVLHYAVQRDATADATAFATLLNRFQSGELVGLSADEIGDVVNLRAGPDADGDGLTDGQEALLGTDPNNPDTDGDGLSDGLEIEIGLDPLVPGDIPLDVDEDGLDAVAEQANGTDPNDPDTDHDGVLDGEEVDALGTDPLNPDTDGDSLTDGAEVGLGTDPLLPDTDGDGLSDAAEVNDVGTNPLLADSDGDGMPDGFEIDRGFDPTDPADGALDRDGDGLTNGQELGLGTDVDDRDSDGDLLEDGAEVTQYGTDPALTDTDTGGASDFQELFIDQTDPQDPADDAAPRGFGFEGIQQNVPVADLVGGGFRECYRGTYNERPAIAGVLDGCNDDVMLIGCAAPGSDTLALAAMGERAEVLTDVGNGRASFHDHNGVSWYYSPTYSWGFFEPGTGVSRNSCDTANATPENRMCWHTSNNALSGGYRCGTSFNNSWERVIYTRSGALGAGGVGGLGCSLPDRGDVTLTIINELDVPAEYAWIDYGCDPQVRGVLAPGEQIVLDTQAAFRWQARDPEFGDLFAQITLNGDAEQTLRLTEAGLPRRAAATTLEDNLSFAWDVAANGQIVDGTNNAFDQAFALTVDGAGFPNQADGTPRMAGRQQVLGPVNMAGLQVSRKIYVPEARAYARFQEVLVNDGAAPVTVDLRITSNLGADAATEVVSTSLPDGAATALDDWIITDDADAGGTPAVMHLFSDRRAASVQPTAVVAATGSDVTQVEWRVTVPPGERVIVLHYAAQRETRAGAGAIAGTLPRFQTGELLGMTAADTAAVINLNAAPDADGDGLSDAEEATLGTNPNAVDTDGDGLLDAFEIDAGFDPLTPGEADQDADADGLDNLAEQTLFTHPLIPDSDADGLLDGAEIDLGTDPLAPDSDGDGLIDGEEAAWGADPVNPDSDGDGLADGDEVDLFGTDPTLADSDGDGMPDSLELDLGLDPTDEEDGALDFDGDGLSNTDEMAAGSDLTEPDSDGDLVLDGAEVNDFGTDPTLADTDDGGATDFQEIYVDQTDPLDPADDPAPRVPLGCSVPGGAPTILRVDNTAGEAPLDVVRLDFGCAEVDAQQVAAGEVLEINTQSGYAWVVREADTGAEIFSERLTAPGPIEVLGGVGQCLNAPVTRVPAAGGVFDYVTQGVANTYEASCASRARGGEAVFYLRVAVPTQADIEITAANYDTALYIRRACDDSQSQVECDDDGGVGTRSRITRQLEAGEYFIFADGYSTNSGSGTIQFTLQPL